MRYVREYATYQRLQGEEVLKKQEQVNRKKTELQQVKVAKEGLLKEREEGESQAGSAGEGTKVVGSQSEKKQRGLQNELE